MKRGTPFIAAAIVILISLISVFVLVLPEMGRVTQANEELQVAQDEEISLQAQLRSLQEAQATAPEVEAAIATIEDQVPPTADLPALFRLLQGAADQSAVDFFSWAPGTPITSSTGSYSTIPSSITVTGGYFALDEYLFLLETLSRAAKVTSITVSPAGSESGTSSSTGQLQLQLTLEFYTTDTSAGPGSIPGPTQGIPTGSAEPVAPETEPVEPETEPVEPELGV